MVMNIWHPASVIPPVNKKVLLRLNNGNEIEGYFSNYNGPSYFQSGVGFGTKIMEWYESCKLWVVEWKNL